MRPDKSGAQEQGMGGMEGGERRAGHSHQSLSASSSQGDCGGHSWGGQRASLGWTSPSRHTVSDKLLTHTHVCPRKEVICVVNVHHQHLASEYPASLQTKLLFHFLLAPYCGHINHADHRKSHKTFKCTVAADIWTLSNANVHRVTAGCGLRMLLSSPCPSPGCREHCVPIGGNW